MSCTLTLQPHVAAEGKRVRWLVSEQGKSKLSKDCTSRAEGLKVLRATVITRLRDGVQPVTANVIEQSGYTESATYKLNGTKIVVTEHKTTPPKPGAGLGPRCRELGTPTEAQALRRRTLRSTRVWSDLYATLAKGEIYAIAAGDGSIARFTTSAGRGAVRLGAEHFVIAQVAVIRDVPGSRDLGAFPTYAEPPAGGLLVKQEGRITAPALPAKVARPKAPARPVAAKPAPKVKQAKAVKAPPAPPAPSPKKVVPVKRTASGKVTPPGPPPRPSAFVKEMPPAGPAKSGKVSKPAPPPAPPAPPKPKEKPVRTSATKPPKEAAPRRPAPAAKATAKATEPSAADMQSFLRDAMVAFAAQKGLGG